MVDGVLTQQNFRGRMAFLRVGLKAVDSQIGMDVFGVQRRKQISHLQGNLDLSSRGIVLIVAHARRVQHPLGCPGSRRVEILVAGVDDGLDASLDDSLGALVAGEQGHVELASLQAAAAVI